MFIDSYGTLCVLICKGPAKGWTKESKGRERKHWETVKCSRELMIADALQIHSQTGMCSFVHIQSLNADVYVSNMVSALECRPLPMYLRQ